MATTKYLFYYMLRPFPDPEALRLWQVELGARLGVSGRVAVSPQGLHGVVGGSLPHLGAYALATQRHPALTDLRFCWGEGRGPEPGELSVRVQEDVSGFGARAEREVTESGGCGVHLTPREVHELVAARGREVVFFDGRDHREAEVGRFRGALVPDANQARDVVRDLRSGKFDALKDRPVVTYCTGGVRSDILTSMMRHRGFSEVYVLDGGIISYGTAFADRGLWEGTLYVLGEQVQIVFSENPTVIGRCESCGASTYSYRECVAPLCSAHALLCNGCADFALCAAHRN